MKKQTMTARKALEMAIESLGRKRDGYKAAASSARYGFTHGIRAKEHYDELQRAIEALEKLLETIGD